MRSVCGVQKEGGVYLVQGRLEEAEEGAACGPGLLLLVSGGGR